MNIEQHEQTLLINKLFAYAEDNYENGWDTIIECWTRKEMADAIEGHETFESARDFLQTLVNVWEDRRADAENSR